MRFRKSIKVAPGVKLNLNKKSAGVSVGNKYFRKSFNTSGRKTTSASLPGTGISFIDTKTKKKKKVKASKSEPVVDEMVTAYEADPQLEEELFESELVDNREVSKSRKPKLWPWLAMDEVLLCVLVGLFNHQTPEVTDGEDVSATSQIASTTEFTYTPDQVSLKSVNGILTAFVADRQVTYSGLAKNGEETYVVKNGTVDEALTGVYDDSGTTWLVKEGKLDTSSNGVVSAGNGDWYAVQNGKVETETTGIRDNEYGSWYVKDGQVQLNTDGIVATDGNEYILDGGKVDKSQNGVVGVPGDWVLADQYYRSQKE